MGICIAALFGCVVSCRFDLCACCRYKALCSDSIRELGRMGITESSINRRKENWCIVNNDGQHRAYLIDVGKVTLASKSKQIKSKKQMALTR